MAEIITTIDLRGSTTKPIRVTDNINYVGLGWDINDVVGVLTITGPGGAFYDNDDFNNPDFVPAISREQTKVINIPLDPTTGYTHPLKGNYTVKLTAKNLDTNAEYEVLLTYSFTMDPPAITADISSGPYTGTFRSEDTTNYGNFIFSLNREHRIQYPTQLLPAEPDVVSTQALVTVTPIYTNNWTVIITTTVEYHYADELIVLWEGTETFTECVYGGSIFDMEEAINNMLDDYYIGLASNTPNQEVDQKRLVIINNAWHLLNQAYWAGDEEECDRLCAIIQDQVQYAGHGTCGGPTSILVIPVPPWGGGGAPATYTFSNGISEAAGIVRLGGSLTQATTLNLLTYLLSISASGGGLASSINIKNDTGVQVIASSATTEGRVSVISNSISLQYNDLATPANNRRYNIGSGGLVEVADYRSFYTVRSLVCKEYVDANNDWGAQVVVTDGTLTGNGTSGSPLAVAAPFQGFTTLLADYGYVEPTHSFAEITSKPTTISGYGITDAVTNFLQLTDTPASYTGHGGKFVRVKATVDGLEFVTSSGFVPDTGGTFTGPVVIATNYDWPLILRQIGTGGSPGVPEAGKNLLGFQDGDGDMTAEIGTDVSGNLYLSTLVGGAYVLVNDNLDVQGNITLTGLVDGVDIAAFYTSYGSHTHTFASITSKPTTLAGYGITDAISASPDQFDVQFTEKTSASINDLLVIEDSADSFTKKYLKISNLPTSAATFLALTDTPSTYAGQAGRMVRVNSGVSALEFVDISTLYISTTAGTLNALTQKVTPIGADIILLEDSANSYAQRKVLLSTLPGSGNVSNTGTPLDNQVAIWTSANIIEGSASFTYDGSVVAVPAIILPITTGQIRFGDADSYFYESADDQIMVYLAAADRWRFTTGQFRMDSNGGPALQAEASSATNPVFCPINSDANTGIGGAATQVSIIVSSVEKLRTTSSGINVDVVTELTAAAGVTIEGVKLIDSYAVMTEITAPAGTPSAGTGFVYAAVESSVGKLWWKNDDGDVFDLTKGSALGASVSSSWKFNTATTNSDPGNKQFKLNNAAYASVTALYFNDITVNGGDCSGVFSLMPIGTRIYIQQLNDGSRIAMYEIATKTDNTGWWTLGVTYVGSTGSLFAANSECGTILYAAGSSTVVYGLTTEIPYTNTSGTGFLYSSQLVYTGTQLIVASSIRIETIGSTLTPWIVNNASGDVTGSFATNNSGTGRQLIWQGGWSGSTTATHYGGNIILRGGDQSGTGGGHGGDVYIYGGSSISSTRGTIYFGTGTVCTLAIDNTETYLVAIDPTTGLLSRRIATSLGGGNVSSTGTPVNNQVAVWTDATTIEGTTGLTYDSATGILDVTTIARPAGVVQSINISAGNASGAAGTDGGSVIIKGGNAILSDTGSDPGRVFLVSGNGYNSTVDGIVFLGDSNSIAVAQSIYAYGASANVSLYLRAKGTGSIIIGGTGSPVSVYSTLGITSNLTLGGDILFGNTRNAKIDGAKGGAINDPGYDLTIVAGAGSDIILGNSNGGNLCLYGGAPYGTGTRGNIYFGTGSTGYLPTKSAETNVVYYDTTTGKLSYGTVSGGVTLSGSTNDQVCTVTGANAIQGEANLTFNGTTLTVAGTGGISCSAGNISIGSNYGIVFAKDNHHTISMQTQDGTVNGYNLTIQGATAASNYDGGKVYIVGGVASGTGDGGNIIISGGVGGGTLGGISGTVYIYPGTSGYVIGNVVLCYDGTGVYGRVGIRMGAESAYALSVDGGVYITAASVLSVGALSPDASCIVYIASTTKGFRLPSMTTTERNNISSPCDGLEVWDVTLHRKYVYANGTWRYCNVT
jgi:hypothetical protein